MADLVATGITVDAARMRAAAAEGYATATDLADYLVRKGMPFRDAHEAVARAVRHAAERRQRSCRPAAAAAAIVRPRDRRRRLRGADPRRLGREPQSPGGHRARAGARRGSSRRARALDAESALDAPPGNRATFSFNPFDRRAEQHGYEKRRLSRAWRHGLPDGRAPRQRGTSRHRLQPHAGQGAALGRKAWRRRGDRRRPPRPPAARSS